MAENPIKAFREFDIEIRKTYTDLNIKHLSEFDFNGLNSIQYLLQIESRPIIHPYPFSIFKIHDEFDFITKELKYLTGLLFLLRPHINNTYFDSGEYLQTNEDHRYLMFANFGLQSIYNFWDRIGDILFLFFTTGLKHDQVYFGRVMNNISSQWHQNQTYIMLKNLYEHEVKTFLNSRHDAVHNFHLECKFYWSNIEFYDNLEKLKEINEEKSSFPEKMNNSLTNCVNAFKLTIDLICELPEK